MSLKHYSNSSEKIDLNTQRSNMLAITIIEKFFGYFQNADGSFSQYSDNLVSTPIADWRQLLWIVFAPVIGYLLYRHYRSKKDAAQKAVIVLSVILILSRVFVHVADVYFGREPFLNLFPFHLCSISAILVPVVALFNIRRIKLAVYTIGIMGGIVTILLGETFVSRFTTFYVLLTILSHTLIIYIPLIDHAAGSYRFEVKNSWPLFPYLLLAMGWATLGNKIFFKGLNTNYMFLEKSGFPGSFGGKYFFLYYVLVFLFLYSVIFIPAELKRRHWLLFKSKH